MESQSTPSGTGASRYWNNAIELIREGYPIAIAIDFKSLEDIGLSPGGPVTASLNKVILRSLIKAILAPIGLAYAIRDERLVTTNEADLETKRITRIDWREGTGCAAKDFDSVIDALQTSVSPNS